MTKAPGWLARIAAHLEWQFESRTLETPQYEAEGLRVGIVPFRSYGSRSALFVRGRVLVEKRIVEGESESGSGISSLRTGGSKATRFRAQSSR